VAILAVDEVWLREPRLLVPGMQPVGNMRVDYLHPMAGGLALALPMVNDVDLVTGRRIAWSGTGKISPTNRGAALIGNTSSATGSIQFTPKATSPYLTIACWFYVNGAPGTDDIMLETSANSNNLAGRWALNIAPTGATSKMSLVVWKGAFPALIELQWTRPSDSSWHLLVASIDAADVTSAIIFIDGVSQSFTTPYTNTTSANIVEDTLYLLSRGNGSLYAGCYLQQLYILSRKLSIAEALSLSSNSTQFLIPA
jgi:hypothetical protein